MRILVTIILVLTLSSAYAQGPSTIYLLNGDSITDVSITNMTPSRISYGSIVNGYQVNSTVKINKITSVETNGVITNYNPAVTNNHLVLAGKYMHSGIITGVVGGTVVTVLAVTGVAPVVVGVAAVGLGVRLLILRIKTGSELKRAGR